MDIPAPAKGKRPVLRKKKRGRLASGLIGLGKTMSSLIFLAIVWQLVANSGIFPKALFPDLSRIFGTMGSMVASGILQQHIIATLYRLGIGLAIAILIGLVVGFASGRSNLLESILIPLVSVILPIPALALVPLFILWFGLGNTTTIALVAFASCIPVIFNTWTGVKTVPVVWVRAAQSMNANVLQLNLMVILPAALPYILNGFRIGLGRAWRAVIAGEMVAATDWGLGYAIFIAREYLRTDVIMTGVIFIGITGLVLEKLLFQVIENYTIRKWGMVQEAS